MLSQQTPAGSVAGVMNLPSRFDFKSSAEYRTQFVKLLSDPGLSSLVVNFSAVTYVDSCGVSTLIAWHQTCKERGKAMVMQNCGARILEIFKVLAVDRLFSIA